MRKFISTALGGAPVNDDDLLDVFNSELWGAIEALLSQHNADTQGIVVSGCVTTNNAGNFDMTPGIVYLNGEYLRLPNFVGLPFPQYIVPSSVSFETRTFQDLTVNNVIRVRTGDLAGSAPGSGQYLAITNLTDLDDRRWNPVTQGQLTSAVAAEATVRAAADSSEATTRATNDGTISGGAWQSVALSTSDIQGASGLNPSSIGTSVVEYRIAEKEVFVFIKLRTAVFLSIPNTIRIVMPSAIRSYLDASLGTNDNLVNASVDNQGGGPFRLASNGQWDGTNHWIEFNAASYSSNDFISATINNLTCQFFVQV